MGKRAAAEPGKEVKENDAKAAKSDAPPRGKYSAMLTWLKFKADPVRNVSGEALQNAQQALEAGFAKAATLGHILLNA